ncbi:MAG TPA: hypothetical protein VF345_08085 [Chthoniobacterales bacterium]
MNHKNLIARRFSAAAFLAVVIAVTGFFTAPAQASPSDEISRAVAAAGAPSVKQADAATFTQAFSSVVIRKKCKDIAPYVTAAVKLRPDLASEITIAAFKAHRRNVNDVYCECLDPIIRAAIAAAPDAKKAIVRAAIAAYPFARECILAAAGQTETETAFFRPPGVDAGNINSSAIGTINPANIGAGGVNTPENP